MRKMRNFKTLTAVTLVTAMTMGTAMTAMAADASGDASGDATSVDVTSSGSYEGGEMKYPTLSVTLPVVSASDYDYIADPNGLIKATEVSGDAAKYADSQFADSAKGLYFLTTAKDAQNPKNIYSESSAAKTVTNENAQDINVTVKLEEAAAGDSDIQYAANSTFTGKDKAVYLAVTDGASKTAALSSTAAEVTTKVEGNKDNYEPKYDSAKDEYGYQKKTSGLTAWNDCSFYLTGALNEEATWGDNVSFPSIKVTWSYAEAPAAPTDAAPSISDITYSKASGTDLVIPYSLGAGESGADALTEVMLQYDGSSYHSVNGTWNSSTQFASFFTIGTDSITISKDYLGYVANGIHKLYVIFDEDESTVLGIDVVLSN